MEALPASFQARLSSSQLLTLQLLGRSPVPDVPDHHHLLPGPALQRTDRARCWGFSREPAVAVAGPGGHSGLGKPKYWRGSVGLLTSLTPRCHLPSKLCAGTAAAAVPADAPGPHHPAPGLQHACGGRGEGEDWEERKGAGGRGGVGSSVTDMRRIQMSPFTVSPSCSRLPPTTRTDTRASSRPSPSFCCLRGPWPESSPLFR